jgi:hypothetical protein
MNESRKTLIIAVAVVAALIAIYSGWKVFGGSPPTDKERMTTNAGPINRMSSMLGPDASGKPRTELPSGGMPAIGQSPGAMSPADRMRGPSTQPR